MFKTNQDSFKAHMDAAMKAAKANDRESVDINLKWAREKVETLSRLISEEYMRARSLDSVPPYQIWTGNRELLARNGGEMGLDRAYRTYAQGVETYNAIVSTYENLKVELRQYYLDKKDYQILKLRP